LVVEALWEGQEPVIAKIFLHPSKAERHFGKELSGHAALTAAGIPTPDLLFQSRLDDGRTPALLFRNMTAYRNLEQHLSALSMDADRLGILKPVVALIADLHSAALIQQDIHPGNFLFSPASVMIVDAADIRSFRKKPFGKRKSLKNLALFFAQFRSEYDDVIDPLLGYYAGIRGWSLDHHLTLRFHRQVEAWRRWRRDKYLQKTRRTCTAFVARRTKYRFTVYDRAWFSNRDRGILASPDTYIEKGRLLKNGNSATVAKVSLGGHPLVIKRYNIKNHLHALQRCLRPSRAMRSWENAHMLKFLGVPTPQPIAVVEERWCFFRKRAYLITEYLPGPTLDQVIASGDRDCRLKTAWLQKIGIMLQHMTSARLSHGDFKATNFLLANEEVFLIDLDGMKRHRSSVAFQRAFSKDLRRLEHNWRTNKAVRKKFKALANSIKS